MRRFCDIVTLSQLFDVAPFSQQSPLGHTRKSYSLLVDTLRHENRWRVHTALVDLPEGWALRGGHLVGDAPGLFHPLYALACLSGTNIVDEATPLPDWPLPQILFTTDENVLRSMTLNGMRMSTEYFDSGSLRVLDLVENRLQLGQRDVIHNVLVYIARQILDARAEELESRNLRAESVAAYLGLEQNATQILFRQRHLEIEELAQKIESGSAGTVRRTLDVPALLEGQLSLLQPELKIAQQKEARWLWLLDEVMVRMYAKVAE